LHRNCLLKSVVEGKIEGRIEMTGRAGKDVSNHWTTLRKSEDSGRDYGLVVRQTTY